MNDDDLGLLRHRDNHWRWSDTVVMTNDDDLRPSSSCRAPKLLAFNDVVLRPTRINHTAFTAAALRLLQLLRVFNTEITRNVRRS